MGTSSLTWSRLVRGDRWLCSPRLALWEKKIVTAMKARLPNQKNLLWILSSGTQSVGEVKAIALTHEALLTSAAAVNKHLAVTRNDRWLLNLPTYHVGGLGILARAHLSRSRVFVLGRWQPRVFHRSLIENKITLCSLVPTQVHDLVGLGLRCPASLRAIVVGGGALDENLYSRARALGWPLLPSYGLTECCSQVATAPLSSLRSSGFPRLKVLPHVKVDLHEGGRVFLRSRSLCRWIARGRVDGPVSLEDPLREGWLPTEDLAENRDGLRMLGRRDDIVKVLGTLVSLPQLESEVRRFLLSRGFSGDLTLVGVRGGRTETSLILITDSTQSLRTIASDLMEFNAQRTGAHRLSAFCWVSKIPRGDLGKVKRASLLSELGLT